MRMAELVMGLVMGIFSIYLMWKSAELPIGWIAGEGPGGGAWFAGGASGLPVLFRQRFEIVGEETIASGQREEAEEKKAAEENVRRLFKHIKAPLQV